MTNKKLLVIFPGGNYTADMPLLYYAKLKYDVLGYESIKITYNVPIISSSFSEILSSLKNQTLSQLISI